MIDISDVFLEETTEDQDLVKLIEARGIEKHNAERCVAFMPIAFGRVIINEIGNVDFSDKYKIHKSSKRYLLTEDKIYCSAMELAIESYKTGLVGREVFSAIATRSAELVAVNKALNNDSDINGAEFKDILLFGYSTIGNKKGWFGGIFS